MGAVNGTPATGSMGFGVLIVSGRSRVPWPPTTQSPPWGPTVAQWTPSPHLLFRGERIQGLDRQGPRSACAALITWYGPDGARTELSTVTFATAVAKTAGALVAEWDVERGAGVRLELPPHWQLPVWLAACDLAGLVVVFDDSPCDVVITDSIPATAAAAPTQTVITSTTTFGLPGAALPAPLLDHARDAMGQPDVYLSPPGEGAWRVAGQLWDVADIADRARNLTGTAEPGPYRSAWSPHRPAASSGHWRRGRAHW